MRNIPIMVHKITLLIVVETFGHPTNSTNQLELLGGWICHLTTRPFYTSLLLMFTLKIKQKFLTRKTQIIIISKNKKCMFYFTKDNYVHT